LTIADQFTADFRFGYLALGGSEIISVFAAPYLC
jgi:hypothetical protein